MKTVVKIVVVALAMTLPSVGMAGKARYTPSSETNPPPKAPLSTFDRFEVLPVTIAPEFKKGEANQRALARIQSEFDAKVLRLVDAWNKRPAAAETPRQLEIAPHVEKLKFVGGGARFWGGALAGDSAVLMKVTLTDKATGTVVAEPEFYQRAAAMGGAWTGGATDNAMLDRIADLVADYLASNFDEAKGGPTGYSAVEKDQEEQEPKK